MNSASIQEAFAFLLNRPGFHLEFDAGDPVYRSSILVASPTFNERDGFDTGLHFPTLGSSRVALGTLLAAIDVQPPHDVEAQADFLRVNLGRLEGIPPNTFEDLVALRFWHGPSWRREWGKAIRLPADALQPERDRLSRLREYFSP